MYKSGIHTDCHFSPLLFAVLPTQTVTNDDIIKVKKAIGFSI